MLRLDEMTGKYRREGYSERNADARVCQDIVLKAISKSNFGRSVTIKGGVVMRSITGDVRRATEDLDLDFIRYSLDDEGASLLINSCEQIFAEKLRSLLRFGPLSTRYKDIFDFCYLKDYVDMTRFVECIDTYIIADPSMRENDMEGIRKRVATTFANRQFQKNVEHSGDRNWLQIDVGDAFQMIQTFLDSIDL